MSNISLYIHWPYCEEKCPYCDFNSFKQQNIYDNKQWEQAYKAQLDFFIDKMPVPEIGTIFLGGGTPSLMPTSIIENVLNYIDRKIGIKSDAEVTFEANPSSVEVDKFSDFAAIGFNRVSVGVQSFDDRVLKFLGRVHNAQEGRNAIKVAQKLFKNYSFDLIYGTAEHDLKLWQQELNIAQDLIAQHISCYQLTIEKGTQFYQMLKQGQLPVISNDIAYEYYMMTNESLAGCGLAQYEISNYATEGHECQHNLGYWNYNQYIGIGPGAHSRVVWDNNLHAVMMHHKPEKWLGEAMLESAAVQNATRLTNDEILSEQLMMGLRLNRGLNIQDGNHISNLYGAENLSSALNLTILTEYEKEGFVNIQRHKGKLINISLTDTGRALHSYIVPRLFKD